MDDIVEWQGGAPPGGVSPCLEKRRQVGWRFQIKGDEAEKLPRDVPRSKLFAFKKFGEGVKAAAEDYQHRIAKDHGLEFKNQYRFRTDPNDGLPYIEFHIRDTAEKDHYSMCDVGDLPLLKEHTWSTKKIGNNIYVQTKVRIDGKMTTKLFHGFKCPDWPIVDHFSEIPEQNRNGLDNRSKHLRDGSGGVNAINCRRRKDNTSDETGVCYHKKSKGWHVQLTHNRIRFPGKLFPGPKDKTHLSYHEACIYARKQAVTVGNTNGQEPEDPDSDEDGDGAMRPYLNALGLL